MAAEISVLTPCFDCAATLGKALASLQAQSYQDWECVLVDDGSIDHPEEVVEECGDARIRYIRLSQNRGRAYARNVATAHARGEYIAMLDADDWLFPSKLEKQLAVLRDDPSLVLVSSYMGVIDSRQTLVGIRGGVQRTEDALMVCDFDKLRLPPISFPASMFRASDAKRIPFVLDYAVAEDTDFLLKLALGRSYAVLSDVEYVYREWEGITLEKVCDGHRTMQKIFSGYRSQFPWQSLRGECSSVMKVMAHKAAHAAGCWNQIVARRSGPPSQRDLQRFASALEVVEAQERNNASYCSKALGEDGDFVV